LRNLIVHIDTAVAHSCVALSIEEKIVASRFSTEPKQQGAFVQEAIEQLFTGTEYSLQQIAAVSTVAGPGSYTGLRVGLASAKGMCYALDKPLITLNTLDLMAKTMYLQVEDQSDVKFIPMIDARRMEVFTAVYDGKLKRVIDLVAMIVDENSFKDLIDNNKCYFNGNGASKFLALIKNRNTVFLDNHDLLPAMALLAYEKFLSSSFANLAHSEPFYTKDFHSS
jgi:tRNA threonylcarbamoyladenosine biosynthesis protein TsaB